jgi:ubiquinone/menaquinone biosynthesis C-methylase UbiE
VTFDENSFVGYYSKHKISPVNQDLSDIDKHFSRRDSLFRTLGIIPSLVKGKTFLEFGPGSGHNAIHIASLKPSKYVLVEGNKTGFCKTQERLNQVEGLDFNIYEKEFSSYVDDQKYNIVWAEGCLPGQNKPTKTLSNISFFVKPSGLLAITTVDAISYCSESMRRLLKYRFFPDLSEDLQKACQKLIPVYEEHLQHLKGMSRSVRDWILDSILQPLNNRPLLSIPKSILTLEKDFDAFASSPNFVTDWRWYKDITGVERKFNENFLDQYYRNNLSFLDYRNVASSHDINFGKTLEKICNESYEISLQIEMGKEDLWDDFFECSSALGDHIKDQAPITYLSIREAITMLRNGNLGMELKYFPPWWGRGQQYLSLIRKELKV